MRFFQQLSIMPRRQGRLVHAVFLFDFMVFGHGLLLMFNSPKRGDLVLRGSVVVAAAVLVGIATAVRLVRWVGRGCPQPPPTVELLGLAKGLGVGAVVMLADARPRAVVRCPPAPLSASVHHLGRRHAGRTRSLLVLSGAQQV